MARYNRYYTHAIDTNPSRIILSWPEKPPIKWGNSNQFICINANHDEQYLAQNQGQGASPLDWVVADIYQGSDKDPTGQYYALFHFPTKYHNERLKDHTLLDNKTALEPYDTKAWSGAGVFEVSIVEVASKSGPAQYKLTLSPKGQGNKGESITPQTWTISSLGSGQYQFQTT